jgi:transcriptional regulator with XRE-family HTH domain
MSVEQQIEDTLGASLKKLRLSAGVTQEELAERAGISARTVSDVERGLRNVVHNDTALRLASALGLADEQLRRFTALARGRELSPRPIPQTGHLPLVPTPFFGRSRELATIGAALEGSNVRLLTLTGPGGIGKTRLALEAARRTEGFFAGGVFFVSLGEVKDASLVASEAARAIGVVEQTFRT